MRKMDRASADNGETQYFTYQFMNSFDIKEFICGGGSALINILLTYPLYKTIFRQMLHGVNMSSAVYQLRVEGFYYLYRGMLPPLLQKTFAISLMFGVFDGTRRYLVEHLAAHPYASKVIAGMTAGVVEASLIPLERVQTLLAHSKYHNHFGNTSQAFKYILNNHGWREFYRGHMPILCRNGPSNAIFFILREEANKSMPKSIPLPKRALLEFGAGALIGAGTSTLLYPLNVIKVTMQSEMGQPHMTMWATCKNIYISRDQRLGNFFRGCAVNAFRCCLTWGIVNTAYENLKKIVM